MDFYFVVFSKYPSLYPKVGYSEIYMIQLCIIESSLALDISEYPTSEYRMGYFENATE
jgi:hypothetical protein